jgi:tRNA threonylcarbamoyladenosine biosynthesis protein TsaE
VTERVETTGSAETEALGARVADTLAPGDVVLVEGELGAGKTTFVRGAARALGVRGPVTSPTFTIGQRYEGPVPVAHLDLYRLAGLQDEDPGLLGDYLGPDSVGFVEWPGGEEETIGRFARVAARVRIEHAGGDTRVVEVDRQ